MPSFSLTSTVDAPAAVVWARAATFAGVNHELRPFLRMVPPRRYRSATIDTVPAGVPLGRVFIWYFGFLPLDYDAMGFAEMVPGSHFHEVSTMGSMRHWEHRRTVESVGNGTRTRFTDEVTFEPRLAIIEGPASIVLRRLFAHRHRRLQTYFAGRSVSKGRCRSTV